MKKKETWLQIMSMVFNVFLIVLCAFTSYSWYQLSCKWSDIEKLTEIELQTGVTLASFVEKELYDISKQNFYDTLNEIYIAYPKLKSSWTGFKPKEKDCHYYGGLFFVFREGKFAFIDRNFVCDSYPRKWAIYNGFSEKGLNND